MATVKITMDNRHQYSDGRYPVVFRLTSKTKTTRIGTKVRLLANEWDNVKRKVTKSNLNHLNINLHLKQTLFSLEKKLLELGSEVDNLNVSELKKVLLNEKEHKKITFFDFATNEIKNLREQGRYGNAHCYETAVNRLGRFTGNEITLEKISYTIISDFETHLLKDGIVRNTVAVYMREIRAIINKAIKKGLLDRSQYPFSNYRIKTERTVSRAITKNDLEILKNYPLEEGCKMWHSRNMFFLIYNLIGINFIDLALLTEDSIQNGRIVYRRRKTGKIYSIKITLEAEKLFSIYKGESKYLIADFHLDDVQKADERDKVSLKLHVCNEHLKKLGNLCKLPVTLTTYVARYTWANVAKSLGYSKDLIAESLGHSYGNQVTGIYLDNYGNEVIDEVNKVVTE